MHSPWGIEYSIIKETGWTRDYLLWGESWINIQAMTADAPYVRTGKKKQKDPTLEDLEAFFKQ